MINFLITYNEGHSLYQERFSGSLDELGQKVAALKAQGAYNVLADLQ